MIADFMQVAQVSATGEYFPVYHRGNEYTSGLDPALAIGDTILFEGARERIRELVVDTQHSRRKFTTESLEFIL